MKRNRQFVFISMTIFSIVFLFVLPLGHDLWYHVYRIGAMAVELEQNPFSLPIRMLSDSYNGYGYGAALYYGDLFVYIPALFVSLGFDIIWTYKIFIIAIWWSCFGIAYYSAGLISSDKSCNLIFAYIFTLSSGFSLNLCIRNAIGEALAMVFLPLIFSSFYCILYKKEFRRRSCLLLALSVSAVAMSHMITLLFCIIVLCVWAAIEFRIIFCEGKWLTILQSAVYMILLSASFLFPMFEQMLYQLVQTPGNTDYQKQGFLDYSIEWIDYFIPYDIKKIIRSLFDLDWNIEYWHPGTIGLFAIILTICIFFFQCQLSSKEKIVYFSSIGFLAALGIPSIMNITKEFLSFVQFPWRILPFITIGLTYTAFRSLLSAPNRKMEVIFYITTLGIFLFALSPRYLYQAYVQYDDYRYIREEREEYLDKYLYRYDNNSADSLYLPQGVSRDYYLTRGEVITSNHEDVSFDWYRSNGDIMITITDNPYSDTAFELPLYMYKGYTAKTASSDTNLTITKSKNSLVQANIGSYTGELCISYSGTICQKICDIISACAIFSLLIYVLKIIMQNRAFYKKKS